MGRTLRGAPWDRKFTIRAPEASCLWASVPVSGREGAAMGVSYQVVRSLLASARFSALVWPTVSRVPVCGHVRRDLLLLFPGLASSFLVFHEPHLLPVTAFFYYTKQCSEKLSDLPRVMPLGWKSSHSVFDMLHSLFLTTWLSCFP